MPELRGGVGRVAGRARPRREKGFSLGLFDERTSSGFPVALVERRGRVEAFATLWPRPEQRSCPST